MISSCCDHKEHIAHHRTQVIYAKIVFIDLTVQRIVLMFLRLCRVYDSRFRQKIVLSTFLIEVASIYVSQSGQFVYFWIEISTFKMVAIITTYLMVGIRCLK